MDISLVTFVTLKLVRNKQLRMKQKTEGAPPKNRNSWDAEEKPKEVRRAGWSVSITIEVRAIVVVDITPERSKYPVCSRLL